jgi:hypothetical protein
VEKSGPGASYIAARNSNSHRSTSGSSAAVTALSSTVILGVPNRLIASQGGAKLRRLVADRQYFGLEAPALRAGAERSLAHLSTRPPEQARIDVRSLGEAFRLDVPASWELLRALLMGGLLYPDGSGGYLPTRHFREYALACVVAPLSRGRAKALIERACGLAARINADWVGNPLQIGTVAVSGSYMSRLDQLSELSLWLILHWRRDARSQRAASSLSKDDALRQILEPMNALSSFMVVRIVADKQAVPRPFSVAFQAHEAVMDSSVPPLERFRDWSASITRRLASR